MKLSKKEMDKMIDQEMKHFKKMKGGDIATDIGTFGESAIDALSTKIPIAKDIYKPLKSIVDSFADSHSNLLESAKLHEEGVDIFHDNDDIPQDNPTVISQGITPIDQKIYRKLIKAGPGGFNKLIYDPNFKFRPYLDNYAEGEGVIGFSPNSKGRNHIKYVIPIIASLHDH